ncbi:phospholipase D/Transphosphatidylase [Nitrosococcus watsonii C-113]|uniref:Phospholipase D/Transphosphatidylase n=2 Tax=Nitrosococcus TaxID=1227 RepID=D8K919_NITWC|nr:phospholipase D/Transphosphatidylase [Nitrosococcus watsonii C-113]
MGCQELPPLDTRIPSHAFGRDEVPNTALGREIARDTAAHPDESGVFALTEPRGAFAARAMLAATAEHTLDVQYYIWRHDITGTLMLKALLEAARRGVRVRLLLDDMTTASLDPMLAALDTHENVEVRLFNPFVHRKFRFIDFITAFARANRRMHNKSFTADNSATIVGGRNIGDEYFGASEHLMFADADVLAIGPVVKAVSWDFDRYWASASAYPAASLLPPSSASAQAEIFGAAARVANGPEANKYLDALHEDGTIDALLTHNLPFIWAPTQMLSDDPAKGVGKASPEALLVTRLSKIIGAAVGRFTLISAYFVPTQAGTDALVALARRGVDITILTNSLEATDVAAVHAGYARYRKTLLEAGIVLYEMRSGNAKTNMAVFGSSAASLHAKTFSIDGERVFVGSFNFDPRSAQLNTELGFVIESAILAQRIAAQFNTAPQYAYRVMLSNDGNVYWLEQCDGKTLRHDEEPYTSIWKRMGVRLLSIMPIEWLL